MEKIKKILWVAVTLLLAGYFLTRGIGEITNSKRLIARGKTAIAQVTDASERVSLRRGSSYFLTVEFQPEGGSPVTKKLKVSHEVFTAAQAADTVIVHYLPEDPTICAAGPTIETPYRNLICGIIFGGVTIFFVIGFLQISKAATNIQTSFDLLKQPRFEYAPADLREFKHLDPAFYENSRLLLEQHGYTHLIDEENISLRNPSRTPTVLRQMLNRDQTIIATLYHFMKKTAPAKESRVLDLETWLSNGTFLLTSNASMAGKLDYPPAINALFLSAETPLDTILKVHQNRLNDFFAQNPGVSPYQISSVADLRNAGDEMQRIKSEFRSQAGTLSKTELERIGGNSPVIDDIHATLAERQANQRPEKK
ncbi:MAG: hypothetical protein JWQ71_2075 [Pedosphaera sp.]|nr:hypothetical protein [Pedosphaera sp.]